jgi:hypothetical protein
MIEEALLRILFAVLEVLGPALVRQKVDEWELGRAASNAAFRAKFPGEEP